MCVCERENQADRECKRGKERPLFSLFPVPALINCSHSTFSSSLLSPSAPLPFFTTLPPSPTLSPTLSNSLTALALSRVHFLPLRWAPSYPSAHACSLGRVFISNTYYYYYTVFLLSFLSSYYNPRIITEFSLSLSHSSSLARSLSHSLRYSAPLTYSLTLTIANTSAIAPSLSPTSSFSRSLSLALSLSLPLALSLSLNSRAAS